MVVMPGRTTLFGLVQIVLLIPQFIIATDEAPPPDLGQQPIYDDGLNPNSYMRDSRDDLVVKTSLFTVQGAVSPETPKVRQFLGIPYAESPVGKLRFRPPVSRSATNEVVDATRHGPSCHQHSPASATRSLFSEHLPGFVPAESSTQSEDCLTLDIWAPRQSRQSDEESKNIGASAVMIWIHGGALMTGGSSTPYERGTRLVDGHEDIIVVSINYRLNIFGFPRAEALDGHNLNPAFLDIRKGVEWVYQNIHNFGGNPNQMVLFGDSAGSSSVDKYTYAWAHDPLVRGFIMMSGQGEISGDPTDHSNFTYVADRVGCEGDDKDELFTCMQEVAAEKIMDVLNQYDPKANGGRMLNFQPQADNETSFSNYTDLQVRGLYAPLPQIIGNCDNEFTSLFQPFTGSAPDQELIDMLSNGMFICPAAKAARARQERGTPIWRYRYFGEFPNLNPLPWLRTYHSSDIPMVFGTSDTYAPDTPEGSAVSKYLQSVWVAFAKDPEHALTEQFNWPPYVETEETLVRLGWENSAEPDFVRGDTYDKPCNPMAGAQGQDSPDTLLKYIV